MSQLPPPPSRPAGPDARPHGGGNATNRPAGPDQLPIDPERDGEPGEAHDVVATRKRVALRRNGGRGVTPAGTGRADRSLLRCVDEILAAGFDTWPNSRPLTDEQVWRLAVLLAPIFGRRGPGSGAPAPGSAGPVVGSGPRVPGARGASEDGVHVRGTAADPRRPALRARRSAAH